MTEQEYEKALAELYAETVILTNKLNELADKRSEVVKDFCNSLVMKYASYINKKVSITFSYINYWGKPCVRTLVGYLRGFYNKRYDNAICPLLSKVKKNGDASLNNYSDGDVFSYQLITEIKIV